jgi:acyl-CoA thioester hydrolase
MPEFNYEIQFDVQFRDLDSMGHVNNAVYASYIEQARIQYLQDIVGDELGELTAVIATLDMEFERPIEYGETVTVLVRPGTLGTTSVPIEYEIRTENGRAATAETLLVAYSRNDEEPRRIPDEWRKAIRAHENR